MRKAPKKLLPGKYMRNALKKSLPGNNEVITLTELLPIRDIMKSLKELPDRNNGMKFPMTLHGGRHIIKKEIGKNTVGKEKLIKLSNPTGSL